MTNARSYDHALSPTEIKILYDVELDLKECERKYKIAIETLRLAMRAANKEWYTAELATDIHNTLHDLGELENQDELKIDLASLSGGPKRTKKFDLSESHNHKIVATIEFGTTPSWLEKNVVIIEGDTWAEVEERLNNLLTNKELVCQQNSTKDG